MVRLSFHGVLIDAYCVEEYPDGSVLVLSNCGIPLTVQACDLGEQRWDVGLDRNPTALSHISPQWLAELLEPRAVTSCEVQRAFSSKEVALAAAAAAAAPSSSTAGKSRSNLMANNNKHNDDAPVPLPLVRSSISRTPQTAHRRIRCYGEGESKAYPKGAPFFVYGKFFTPSMVLLGVPSPNPQAFLRQAAVCNVLLPLCRPSPSPVCYYANVHEEHGTNCTVMEDITTKMVAPQELKNSVALCKRALVTLALYHGRFLIQHPSVGSRDAAQRAKDLSTALIHKSVYERLWREHLAESTATVEVTAEDDRTYEEQVAFAEANGKPRPIRKTLPFAADEVEHLALPGTTLDGALEALFAGPVTLLHGSLSSPEHYGFLLDTRAMPSCLLFDWKQAGIGPAGVDLCDVLVLFLTSEELSNKEIIDECLTQYVETMAVMCGVDRNAQELAKEVRAVLLLRCFTRTRAEGFAWGAERKRPLVALLKAWLAFW